MTTVVIVDDHPIVRAGMRSILQSAADIQIIGEGANGADALRLVEAFRPDVLALDVQLPDMNGLEVTRRLREKGFATAILILTAHNDSRVVFGLLESGAVGYVLKDEALETLVNAVRSAARGDAWLSPALANVAKHAWARRVNIRLADEADGLVMLIEDDGRGFAPPGDINDLAAQGHFGLVGLRERVNLIGGHLSLQSAPGQGMHVRVEWRPLS